VIEKYRIKFPKIKSDDLEQDEEFFFLVEPDGREIKLRFHEYAEIYRIKGLYEQLFYERLKCNSPAKVSEALRYSLSQVYENFACWISGQVMG